MYMLTHNSYIIFDIELYMYYYSRNFGKNMSRLINILDGGIGNYIFKRKGLPYDKNLLTAKGVIESQYHSMIIDTHIDYIKNGSNIIKTFNGDINPFTLKGVALSKKDMLNQFFKYTQLSTKLAKQARDIYFSEYNNDKYIKIAGILPCFDIYYNDVKYRETEIKGFYEIILTGLQHNVDIILCQNINSYDNLLNILDVIERLKLNQKCWISFKFNDNMTLYNDNITFNDIITQLNESEYFDKNIIKLISINNTSPECISNILSNLSESTLNTLKSSNINIGILPHAMDSTTNDIRADITPQYFTEFTSNLLNSKEYITLIGGSDGIMPEHIKSIYNNITQNSTFNINEKSK